MPFKPMSEADWRQCRDPIEMLTFIPNAHRFRKHQAGRTPGHTSWRGGRARNINPYLHRKLRLLACGYCRRIWDRLPQGAYRQAVETAERYADGEAREKDLKEARDLLVEAFLPYEIATRGKVHRAITSATRTFDREDVGRLSYVALSTAWEIAELTAVPLAAWQAATPQWDAYIAVRGSRSYMEEQELRANLIRDVMPSPFDKIEFDPAWLSWNNETVTHLARTIYEEHRLRDLIILADALEEAGCVEPSIIEHCRSAGPHLRGCWVIDLLLGKAQ